MTVWIVCAEAPPHVVNVPAWKRRPDASWFCSYCGARVKVVT